MTSRSEAFTTHCAYPDCNCPFDAPADPNWCARGLPKSLEQIAERHLRQDLYLFGLKGLLADPAILTHIPAVKALREELAEETYIRERLAGILADTAIALKGPEAALRGHGWHDIGELAGVLKAEVEVLKQQSAALGSQLAELRQGGEAVGEVVLESIGVPGSDAQIVRFHMYKEIPPVGTKLYTQPAIPPGYVVPDAMTFLRDNDLAASGDWMQGWNDCRAMLATPADIKEGA